MSATEAAVVEMAFSDGALVFAGTSHLARRALSPSAMLAILLCPARWAAEATIPRPDDPFGPAELGSAAHSVLEALFSLPPASRGPVAAEAALAALSPSTPVEDLGAWQAEVRARVDGIWRLTEPARLDVLATEVRLEAEVRGVPLRGIVDLADRTGAGVRIVDHKTGRPRGHGRWPGYPDQLRIYALLWEELTGEAPAVAELWWSRYGVAQRVDLSGPAKAATLALARRSWATLASSVERGRFATQPSPLCPWCPLVGSCPAAKRAGHLPVPGAPTPTYEVKDMTVPEGTINMSTSQTTNGSASPAMVNEAKPWEPFCFDGTPNWASYQAISARRLVVLAKDCIVKTGQSLTPRALRGYAALFAQMVYTAQRELGRKPTLQSGLAGVLIALLESSVRDVVPPALDDSPDAMKGWTALMTRRIVKMAQIMGELMDAGTDTAALTEG